MYAFVFCTVVENMLLFGEVQMLEIFSFLFGH